MKRPKPIILTQKDLMYYIYDLECYIDSLEVDIKESSKKVNILLERNELLQNRLIELKKIMA